MSERDGIKDAPPSPKLTPPGSLIELPPSPPSTGRPDASRRSVEALAGQIEHGGTIEFPPGDFPAKLDRLKEAHPETWGWLQDKVRYVNAICCHFCADYNRFDLIKGKHLSRRMPTAVHEFVAQKLGDAFKEGVESIKRSCNDATRRLINDTRALGFADVRFTESWYRSPDQQFKVKSLYYPGIVYEIAYAQAPSGLTRSAKDYIVESYGKVQKVVGLKINLTSLEASLTVWSPALEVEDGITQVGYKKSVDSERVRDADGNPLLGSLKLYLCDLGPPTELSRLYPGAQLEKGVEVTYEKIAGYIREAEDERETVRNIPAPPANTMKRPRSESSADDLDSADEHKYKRAERMADDASFAEDEEYKE